MVADLTRLKRVLEEAEALIASGPSSATSNSNTTAPNKDADTIKDLLGL